MIRAKTNILDILIRILSEIHSLTIDCLKIRELIIRKPDFSPKGRLSNMAEPRVVTPHLRFDMDTATVSDTTSGSSASTVSSERPLRSPVWKHFWREKGKAVCLLCNKTMSYKGRTTSNLKQYLHCLHKPNIQVEAGDKDEV